MKSCPLASLPSCFTPIPSTITNSPTTCDRLAAANATENKTRRRRVALMRASERANKIARRRMCHTVATLSHTVRQPAGEQTARALNFSIIFLAKCFAALHTHTHTLTHQHTSGNSAALAASSRVGDSFFSAAASSRRRAAA